MLDRKRLSLKCHGAKIRIKFEGQRKNWKVQICLRLAPIHNDSLCRYYKNLWTKCKKLWLNKFIHGFWTFNGSIRLKLTETGSVIVITHDADLEELFPGNELISEDTR